MIVYENIHSIGQEIVFGNSLYHYKLIPLRMTRNSVQKVEISSGEEIGHGSGSLFNTYDFSSTENGVRFHRLLLNGNISYKPEYEPIGDGHETDLITYHFFDVTGIGQVKQKSVYRDVCMLGGYLQDLVSYVLEKQEEGNLNNYLTAVRCNFSYLQEDDYYIPVYSLFFATSTYMPHQIREYQRNAYTILTTYIDGPEISNYWDIGIQYDAQGNMTNLYRFTVKLPSRIPEEDISSENDETSSEYIQRRLDEMAVDEGSFLYSVPEDAQDWLNRTINFRAHVTIWDKHNRPIPINSQYTRFVDSNCYAYTQPVWKAGSERWRMNNSVDDGKNTWYDADNQKCTSADSWIVRNGYLSVYSAYFNKTDGSKKEKPKKNELDSFYWYPYVILSNGQGHNIIDGYTLGVESQWAYNCGIPELGFDRVNNSVQSAVCFSNILNLTPTQNVVYAYTSGDDYSSTIEEASIPRLTLDVSAQTINRIDLELNNTLTRW